MPKCCSHSTLNLNVTEIRVINFTILINSHMHVSLKPTLLVYQLIQ